MKTATIHRLASKYLAETQRVAGFGHATHVRVRELPPILISVLKEIGYGRSDIGVHSATTFSFQDMGGDGYRAFTAIVNMETGARKIEYGSWGGPNMNAPRNIVDSDDRNHPILENMAVIQGNSGGGHPVYATLTVNPVNMAALIPVAVNVTAEERKALNAIGGIKPGYRADEFERNGLGEYSQYNPLIISLVKKGLLKITGAGIQMTTEGKSVR